MAGILGGGSKATQAPVAVGALNIQQSSYGVPVTILYGTTRTTGNLLWYGNFYSVQQSTGGGGGKGGSSGGGGKGGGSSQFLYYASMAIGLCEGTVNFINNVWVTKQTTNMPGIGGQLFNGALNQSPWGYLTSNFAGQDDGYSNLAYVALQNYALGTSAETPQFSFEVAGPLSYTNVYAQQDALPDQVISDFLGRAAFPSTYIGSLTSFSNYCIAMGFFISPLVNQQRSASDWLKEWADTLNSEYVWSNKQLTVIPYADSTVTNNGVSFVPNLTPIYNLTDDDFIVTGDEDPVTIDRPDLADAYNQQPIEYFNRADQYNIETYTAEDAASVAMNGIRTAPTLQAHHVTNPLTAQTMANISLWRQINIEHGAQFSFKLPWNYILLDPMDLVTITDTALGMTNKLVRIKKIQEDKDGLLSITAEDMPGQIALPALFNSQNLIRATPNYNVAPGNINTPVFFESPLARVQSSAVELNIAVSGGANWGGCDVWMSTDGNTYTLFTQIVGGSRMGVLTAPLATFTPMAGANNIDSTDTLAISMAESNGVFNNAATNADAVNLNSLCFVDGEFICFGNDVLTAANAYNLTYLNRGCYASTISAHATGSNFVRVDNSVNAYDIDQSRVGQTLYFKFTSFNLWGGGLQSLANVPAYSYKILGTALLTPLANPTNVFVSYNQFIGILNWTGINDIRTPLYYEVRKGTTFATAQIVEITPNTSLPVYGTGTYWITALYFTPLGVPVYSSSPVSIAVSTPSIPLNVIDTFDEYATGWSGTCSGGAGLSGGYVQLAGAGDILSDSDIITTPDIIYYGGVASSGTYTAPAGHTITSNSVVNAKVIFNWLLTAINSAGGDIISMSDVLSVQDILNGGNQSLVYAVPQINLSTNGGVSYSGWQNWTPGFYTFNALQYRIIIYTLSSQVTAVLEGFSVIADIPTSTQQGSVTTSNSGSVAVTFTNQFNEIPVVTPTIVNAQAGDLPVLGTPTETGFTIAVVNAGVNVIRTVTWNALAY